MSRFGAAVIDDESDEGELENPHRAAVDDDESESSSEDSELEDEFLKMQEEAARPRAKPEPPKEEKAESQPKKKKRKKNKLNIAAPEIIDFGDLSEEEKVETVEVVEEKQFAGETVLVKKVVAKGSKEEKKYKRKKKKNKDLGDILNGLKGKKKINTLDKCQLDWEKDKSIEGDGEELSLKAKNGELEKKKFLKETDYRLFEIERDERNEQRRKKGIIP
jgi:hypothetical protein